MNTLIGTIVRACAGRDNDSFFVVTANGSSGFVYIADGKSRKLLKPKKKNVKHLQFTKTVIELDGLTDKKLRKFLSEYKSTQTLSGGNTNV